MSSSDWGTTRQVPVHVVLTQDVMVHGQLHLLERTTYPTGPETPLELLNRAEPFFALTLDRGAVLISKAQTVVVACRDGVAPLDPDRASVAKDVELTVELHGGAEYRGHATFELPPSSSRPLDYVNALGSFFALADGDTIRYVNKAFVRLIRPLD